MTSERITPEQAKVMLRRFRGNQPDYGSDFARALSTIIDMGAELEARTGNFAWTATSGYRLYPAYVNLTGNRLAVRGPEKPNVRVGDYVAVDLPDEALAQLRAAITLTGGER